MTPPAVLRRSSYGTNMNGIVRTYCGSTHMKHDRHPSVTVTAVSQSHLFIGWQPVGGHAPGSPPIDNLPKCAHL